MPEECPFLGRARNGAPAELATAAEDAPVTVGRDGEDVVTIGASIHLAPPDADRIRRATGARLIAFVGAFKSGKTSLITEFYEMLRRRAMRGFTFAGSDTISGFEYRAFLSRMQSGGSDAGTFRTSALAGLHFLHLQMVRPDQARLPIHLLMSDRAGETVEELLDEPSEFNRLHELRHADAVVLVVDGAQMADPVRRGQHRLQTMSIVQAIRDAGLLAPAQRFDVVMAKLDRVSLSNRRADTEQAFEGLVDGIRKTLHRTAVTVTCHIVAARSEDPEIKRGHGLEQLLEAWTQAASANIVHPFAIDVDDGDAFASLVAARRQPA